MGILAAGQVVAVPFPYSDLTGRKLRPALLLVPLQHHDWIICQITSNPFADRFAVALDKPSFVSGGLPHVSYARPTKLFSAHENLITQTLGQLSTTAFEQIRETLIAAIRSA
ncbi:MAG: type II toxin-antitoxin system PemK/MazF family toxin [Acidobacteriaceae bacterium]|nr:type II toxin-antitoxin system PemK/MazF family toxin [Acidobacteriaceae bacterium]